MPGPDRLLWQWNSEREISTSPSVTEGKALILLLGKLLLAGFRRNMVCLVQCSLRSWAGNHDDIGIALSRHTLDTRINLHVEGTRDFSDSGLSPHTSALRHKVSVLLVADHVLVRQGLRAVLDAYANIELAGEAGNGEEAVRLVDQQCPTVVVMDINMPKMNGIDATERIKLHHPETIVIGLAVNVGKENGAAMKRAGAIQLMAKEAAVEQLYNVIQAAVEKRAT